MRRPINKNWLVFSSAVACLILALFAAVWAGLYMASLSAYRSPLRDAPPTAGAPLGEALTRRVIFVLVDALRLDTALDPSVMPFLNSLRQRGAFARMHSRPPSYSEPGYTVLLTGAWPDISDGPAINHPYEDIYPFTQDDLFSASTRAGLQTAVSGYYWFEKLIPQSAVHASFYTAGEDQAADNQVVEAALPWLDGASAYQLILIHIDQVDYAGHHEGGPRDPRWNQAARRADALIERICASVNFSQDTLLVVSDHGQIDRGGHGGDEPVVLTEPFLLVGAGVKPGDLGDVAMVDVAPTLAALLGTNIPASSQGRVLTELLDLTPQRAAEIQAAWNIQQNNLLEAYRAVIGDHWLASWSDYSPVTTQEAIEHLRSVRLTAERLPRLTLAILVGLLPALSIAKIRSKYLAWLIAGAVVFLAVFHIYYSVILGRTYSLSSVDSAEGLLASVGLGSALPFLLGWVVVILGNGSLKTAPRNIFIHSLSYTWIALYLLCLPVLWSYTLNGHLVTWTLPDFSSAFLGFLAMLQMLFVGLLGLAISGCSAVLASVVRHFQMVI